MIRKLKLVALLNLVWLASGCSPRDYLSRRLASDLIATSDLFKGQQQFVLRTGVVSSKDYPSPEYLILQHHGWIVANNAPCPAGTAPAPCWDIVLTPSGVETVRALAPAADGTKASIPLPAAKRQLLAVTGVTEQGSAADVDFTWKWVPLNEVGDALYPSGVQYKSTVAFRKYDDGWRVLQTAPRPGQSLDDAIKNAEPVS